MVGYNDSKPFPHEFLNDHLRRWGLSLPTLQTWNSIRALDWLTALPDVDVTRIGCTGESGGGTQTFLLTALDDRIKVSAPVVMVSDTFQGGCVCENAAGLRLGTDNVEFAALCAPRPLILVGASGDWTARTMERAYPAIRGVYSLVGSTADVSAQVFNFPHNYNQTSRNAVYAAMGHRLLGIQDPETTREGRQQPEKPEALLTFDSRTSRPEESEDSRATRGVPHRHAERTHRRSRSHARTGALGSLAPAAPDEPESPDRRRQPTYRGAEFPRGPAHPTRGVHRHPHACWAAGQPAKRFPSCRLIPPHPSGRLTVIADQRGKAALVASSGEPAALVRALLARGHIVVGYDPLFVGESIDPRDPVSHRPETDHFETYNPVPAADQMQDLASVLAWARAAPTPVRSA